MSELAPLYIILGLLAYGLYAFLRQTFGRGKASGHGSYVCPACGTRGEPTRRTRGSLAIEILLWLCFIVPGLIYSLWRLTTRYDACPACGAAGMIPVATPRGQQLIGAPPKPAE